MKTLPTIRIQTSYLLQGRYSLANDGLDKIVKIYQRAWKKQEKPILKALQDVTRLAFAQNFIDVYIDNPTRHSAISNPMIIGGGLSPIDFVLTLTHELIHRLTSDNTSQVNWHWEIQKLYPNEEVLVANHIMVHAILEAIFSKQIISRDIKHCAKFPAYKRAWEIVKEIGYKDIINHFRKEGRK